MSATSPSVPDVAGAPPRLRFAVLDAAPLERAAVPTLRFSLQVRSEGPPVRSIQLDTQIRIAARRRSYDDRAAERLFELFGAKESWGSTLSSLLWTRATLVVPAFSGETVADLDVPCTYDLDVLATRYFDALSDGDVPLELLFSGSVFYATESGMLQTTRLSWEQEAEYRLPVTVWKQTLERHFRGTAWLRVSKENFDRLAALRAREALPGWDATIDALLDRAGTKDPSWTP